MSKMPLEGNNTEEFLNRFILTQVTTLYAISCEVLVAFVDTSYFSADLGVIPNIRYSPSTRTDRIS